MSNRYKGGVISATAPTGSGPYDTDTAKGVWTLDQAMQLKKQGLWPTAGNVAPPTVIGQAYGGGFYAGQISTSGNGTATHYLVVGPVSTAQSTPLKFKNNNSGGDPTSVIDGPTNSATMNSATYPAAEFCEALTIAGQTDWYMPAKNELEICYYNLKPTTTANNTGSGTNTNAVPSRGSNYSSGTPAQTSAAAFVTSTGAEAFTAALYWSSTEATSASGWLQLFSNGQQISSNAKTYTYRVRAVRRVPV